MPAKMSWIVCPLQEPSQGLLEEELYVLSTENLVDSHLAPYGLEKWVNLEDLLVNMPLKPVTTMPFAADQAPNRTVTLNGTDTRQRIDECPPSTLHASGAVEVCDVRLPFSVGEDEWGLLEALENTSACGSLEMPANSAGATNGNTLDLNATSLDLGETFGYGTINNGPGCGDGLSEEDILAELLNESSAFPSVLDDLMSLMETETRENSSETTGRVCSRESTESWEESPLSSRRQERKRRHEGDDEDEDSVSEAEGDVKSSKAMKYQEMRKKNNEASKRSRKQRKAKEKDLGHVAKELESKNENLKRKVMRMEENIKILKARLMQVMVNK